MKASVLVVDDDPSIRYSVSRVLDSHGYSVTLVENSKDCLRELLRVDGNVDLILLDIMLPELSGVTIFKAIKKKYPHLKIVFMSALKPPEDVRELLKSEGGIPNIMKPFDNRILLEAVEKTLHTS
ncbi:MAG: response regulator, partial [Candidatus Altiarchaeota archaeon]|nr:response regulator [Candidatus Altiarchaeota archaeon]